jgi:hypothetical protein
MSAASPCSRTQPPRPGRGAPPGCRRGGQPAAHPCRDPVDLAQRVSGGPLAGRTSGNGRVTTAPAIVSGRRDAEPRDQHRCASRGMQTWPVRREVPDQRRPACRRRHGKITARFGQGFSQWRRRPGEGRAGGPLHRRQGSALTCLAGPARESVSQDAQRAGRVGATTRRAAGNLPVTVPGAQFSSRRSPRRTARPTVREGDVPGRLR